MNDVKEPSVPENRPTDGPESGVRRFFAFVENFWYHHKFGTLVTIFLVIVLLVCTLQMCGKNSYDVHVLYSGPWFDCAGASRISAIESAFRQFMDDFDGDGQKTDRKSVV